MKASKRRPDPSRDPNARAAPMKEDRSAAVSMAGPHGNLPGFYFDPQTQKYFRLPPDGRPPVCTPMDEGDATTPALGPRKHNIANVMRSSQRHSLFRSFHGPSRAEITARFFRWNKDFSPNLGIISGLTVAPPTSTITPLTCYAFYDQCVVGKVIFSPPQDNDMKMIGMKEKIIKPLAGLRTIRAHPQCPDLVLLSCLGDAESGWVAAATFEELLLKRVIFNRCTVWGAEVCTPYSVFFKWLIYFV
jgi:hypothetical protein